MSENADNKHRELAQSISEGMSPDTRVVYLADSNHYRGVDIYGAFTNKPFWDEMSHNGKTNILAIEKYSTPTTPLFDAFYNKQITRGEFLSALNSAENTGQTTDTEDRQINEGLADTMEAGIRVVPANNSQGLGSESMRRVESDIVAMKLEGIYWLREHKDEIKQDPQAFVLTLMERNDATPMSNALHKDYVAIKKATLDLIEKNEPVPTDYIIALNSITSSRYNDYLEHRSKVEPKDLSKRKERDDQVIATIQHAAEEPNSRVFLLYGAGHAGGPDGIMAQLHQNGLQAELVVPYLGKDHFTCLKPNIRDCAEVSPEYMNNYIRDNLRDTDYTHIPDINEPLKKVEHKAEAPPAGGPS